MKTLQDTLREILEGAGPMENRDALYRELLLAFSVVPSDMPLTRFQPDMDGSMEPDENGDWVRYSDLLS